MVARKARRNIPFTAAGRACVIKKVGRSFSYFTAAAAALSCRSLNNTEGGHDVRTSLFRVGCRDCFVCRHVATLLGPRIEEQAARRDHTRRADHFGTGMGQPERPQYRLNPRLFAEQSV